MNESTESTTQEDLQKIKDTTGLLEVLNQLDPNSTAHPLPLQATSYTLRQATEHFPDSTFSEIFTHLLRSRAPYLNTIDLNQIEQLTPQYAEALQICLNSYPDSTLTPNPESPNWLQSPLLGNPQTPREQFTDENQETPLNILATHKEYFTLDLHPEDIDKFSASIQFIPEIYDSLVTGLEQLAQEEDDLITFLLPTSINTLAYHRHPLVIHHRKPETGPKIRAKITELINDFQDPATAFSISDSTDPALTLPGIDFIISSPNSDTLNHVTFTQLLALILNSTFSQNLENLSPDQLSQLQHPHISFWIIQKIESIRAANLTPEELYNLSMSFCRKQPSPETSA